MAGDNRRQYRVIRIFLICSLTFRLLNIGTVHGAVRTVCIVIFVQARQTDLFLFFQVAFSLLLPEEFCGRVLRHVLIEIRVEERHEADVGVSVGPGNGASGGAVHVDRPVVELEDAVPVVSQHGLAPIRVPSSGRAVGTLPFDFLTWQATVRFRNLCRLKWYQIAIGN